MDSLSKAAPKASDVKHEYLNIFFKAAVRKCRTEHVWGM